MTNFISAVEAKNFSTSANLDIGMYRGRLAQMIDDNAKQGNTAVFTVLPKHLPLQDVRDLSADLTQLGYHVRFEVNQFYYSLNVYWM